jgi:hypothetical protein
MKLILTTLAALAIGAGSLKADQLKGGDHAVITGVLTEIDNQFVLITSEPVERTTIEYPNTVTTNKVIVNEMFHPSEHRSLHEAYILWKLLGKKIVVDGYMRMSMLRFPQVTLLYINSWYDGEIREVTE